MINSRLGGALNISRALGDFKFKDNYDLPQKEQAMTALPDVKSIKKSEIDFIIMGSDGIFERFTN